MAAILEALGCRHQTELWTNLSNLHILNSFELIVNHLEASSHPIVPWCSMVVPRCPYFLTMMLPSLKLLDQWAYPSCALRHLQWSLHICMWPIARHARWSHRSRFGQRTLCALVKPWKIWNDMNFMNVGCWIKVRDSVPRWCGWFIPSTTKGPEGYPLEGLGV